MNQFLIKQLEKFRIIEPDEIFLGRSRALVIAHTLQENHHYHHHIEWRTLLWAASVAGVLTIAVMIPRVIGRPHMSALDQDRLIKEMNALSINIQLKEIAYQEEVNQVIASALTEISNTDIRHLNTKVLEAEQEKFNFESSQDKTIDELLNKVLF